MFIMSLSEIAIELGKSQSFLLPTKTNLNPIDKTTNKSIIPSYNQ